MQIFAYKNHIFRIFSALAPHFPRTSNICSIYAEYMLNICSMYAEYILYLTLTDINNDIIAETTRYNTQNGYPPASRTNKKSPTPLRRGG